MRIWNEIRGYPLRAFLICLAAYTFSQMDLALFGYAVPAIRQEFGVSLKLMGWVFSASFIIGGVGVVGLALLADRAGRTQVMQASIISSSIVIALHAIVPGLLLLTLLRGLAIATGGILYPVSGAIVAEEAPARLRGLFAGLLQTGYPIGWLFASLLAAPLLTRYGWRPVFLIGLLSLPYVFVVRRYLRESPRYVAAKKLLATDGTVHEIKLAALLVPAMRRRTITLFIAQYLFVVAYGGSAFWFPTYFVEARGFELGTSTYLVGIGNGVGVIGYILAAVVGEFYLTRRNTVVLWTLLGNLAFLYLIWGTTEFAESIAAFAVMCVFFYGAIAVKFAFVAEVFPTHLRATGLAVCSSLAVTLGIATGPLAVSYVVEAYGWNIAFSTVVVVPLFFAGLLYLLLKPIPSGLEVEEVSRLSTGLR